VSVHAVALCELASASEAEAAELAPLLGMGPYDVRVWMSGILPRIVLQTPDHGIAVETTRRLRARGHGVVMIDVADVVSGAHMVPVHRFIADDASLWANDGEGDFLPWELLGAIMVVVRRVEVLRTTRNRESLRAMPARAAPTTNVTKRSREHLVEHVAYLFPREGGGVPWLVREQETQYRSLGPRMKLTCYENFWETVALLRARAPGAIYDERFAREPRTAAQLVKVLGHESAMPAAADIQVDMLVHVLGEWLLRGHGGPYRQSGRGP
jgi:hypothetical protein